MFRNTWRKSQDKAIEKLKKQGKLPKDLKFEDIGFVSNNYADGGYFDGTIPKVSTYMSTYAKGGIMSKDFWSWRYAPNDDSYKSVVIYKTDVDDENSYDSVEQIKEQLTKEGVTKFIEEESKHFWSWKYAPNDNTYKSVIIYKTDIDDENSYDSVKQIKEQLTKEGVNKFIEEDEENYAKGGEVAKAEILGLSKNIMGTTSIEMKISGMRKSQDFSVYPIGKDDSKEIITIQSETRIGKIDLSTGRGLMSQSHSNGAYFVHFQMDKLTPFTINEKDLKDLRTHIFRTAGDNVGSRGIFSDNSGASSVYAKGGGVDDYVSMKRLLSEFKNEKEIFDGQIVNRGTNDFKIENDNFYIKRPNENWKIFRKIKYADGGLINAKTFDFLKKHKGFSYTIEEKPNGRIKLQIQEDGSKSYAEIYNSTDDKNVFYINSVSGNIGDKIEIGKRWYGDTPYNLNGVKLWLKERGYIKEKINVIKNYPTTYNEYISLLTDYEPLQQFAEFIGYTYPNYYFDNDNLVYTNYMLPQYKYFNVKGYLEPIFWNNFFQKLFKTKDIAGSFTLFGTQIGTKSNGNYGSQQGFINSGEQYLLNLDIEDFDDLLDIKNWHQINDKNLEIDSKFIKDIEDSSKNNFKIILNKIVLALKNDKEFQNYLKTKDSESVKGKGLKSGDSIVESFDKYVKVKTKENETVYVVLTTGERTFNLPTKFADGGFMNNVYADGGFMNDVYAKGGLNYSLVPGTSGIWLADLPHAKYKITKEVSNAQASAKNNETYVNIVLPKGSIVNNLKGGVFVESEKLKKIYSEIYNEKYGLRIIEKRETLNEIYNNSEILEYADGGGISLTKDFTILKDDFQKRENEPNRVYHTIEGLYKGNWFTAKTDNSFFKRYGSDGINKGGVYQLDVWKGGNPVGRDKSTTGGHVSEDHIAMYWNKWDYRSMKKADKQIVSEIVNLIDENVTNTKRKLSSIKFADGGFMNNVYADGGQVRTFDSIFGKEIIFKEEQVGKFTIGISSGFNNRRHVFIYQGEIGKYGAKGLPKDFTQSPQLSVEFANNFYSNLKRKVQNNQDLTTFELIKEVKFLFADGGFMSDVYAEDGAKLTPTASVKSETKVGETYIRKDMRGNWKAETNIDNFNDYDWRLSTIKTYSGKLITSAQGGKTEPTGSKGYEIFKYTPYEDPNYTLEVSSPKRLTDKVVSEQHVKGLAKFKKFMETGMFRGGGKISKFDKLSDKVAKEYEGKPVKSQFQEEYGKYYSKAEAQEVGDKVAGKVKAMQMTKK